LPLEVIGSLATLTFARYIPAELHAKAFSVRYCLGFTVSGFAAPFIALLHAQGGFPLLMAVTGMFGAVVVLCALSFSLIANSQPLELGQAGEEGFGAG
jgi:hypothetical protein